MTDATMTIDARRRGRERRQQVATVTATQLGAHLGITRVRIAALADEHVIDRLPNGKFNQDDALELFDVVARSEAALGKIRGRWGFIDGRFIDAKAELLRLRIAEKRRDPKRKWIRPSMRSPGS